MKTNPVKGVITALVTPFLNQVVDYKSLRRLVESQLEGGVDGFVVNGTTGESPTLQKTEVEKIYGLVRDISGRDFPIYMGTGTNSTQTSIELSRWGQDLGATGLLIVVPYYNKPTQEGQRLHYQAIARAVDIPIILYNVPGRTVVSMNAQTCLALAQEKNIVATKEASGNMDIARDIMKEKPEGFHLLSGDDSTCIEQMTLGSVGVISVISHLIPHQLKRFVEHAIQDFDNHQNRVNPNGGNQKNISSVNKDSHSTTVSHSTSKKLIEEYKEIFGSLNSLLGVEPNPTPVKRALQIMGIIESAELRLPLVEMTPNNSEKIKQELLRLGLIS